MLNPDSAFGLIDWLVVVAYFVAVLIVGMLFVKKASSSIDDYFLAGRSLPWWVAGTSMVATMFAADTPLFHTANVRQFGMDAGFLFFTPGFGVILAAVLFVRLWRRVNVMTEIELIEMRYSGKPAAIFRGFNAIYGGLIKAALIMGWVTLAMGVVVESLLGIDKVWGVSIFLVIVMIYSASSGMWGVVATDFIQYFVATAGTLFLAYTAVDACGGLAAMNEQIKQITEWSGSEMRVIPDPSAWNPNYSWALIIGWSLVFSLDLATASGFLGQRVYASKDEKNASYSTLWFAFCYYVLNGWPWIITGVASMIVLGSTDAAAGLGHSQEIYPAMINKLMPTGFRGLMGAAMIAAFMSTISTIMNWGSSFMVNDFYRRFIKPSESKTHYVWVSRIISVCLLVFGGWFAFQFENITEMLVIVPQYLIGGTLVLMARWLWSRTNIWSEITAIVSSFAIAFFVNKVLSAEGNIFYSTDSFEFYGQRLLTILAGTTAVWIFVTLMTKPEDDSVLIAFYKKANIPGPGWSRIRRLCAEDCPKAESSLTIVATLLIGMAALYGLLISIGYAITLNWTYFISYLAVSLASVVAYAKLYRKLTKTSPSHSPSEQNDIPLQSALTERVLPDDGAYETDS